MLTKTNLTDKIFKLEFPYSNPYQGMQRKLLFCCSVGLLRSPTAAVIATEYGYNTRSCGSDSKALIPLSANLIIWSDNIVFINKQNYDKAIQTFDLEDHYVNFKYEIEHRAIVWNIEDEYEYMNPELVLKVRKLLNKLPENISK